MQLTKLLNIVNTYVQYTLGAGVVSLLLPCCFKKDDHGILAFLLYKLFSCAILVFSLFNKI